MLEAGDGDRRLRQYLDLESLFPLYVVDGPVVIQHAERWSGDRPGYPSLKDAPSAAARVARVKLRGMAL